MSMEGGVEYDARNVSFEAECLAETESSLLFDIEGEEVWLPKSQIHDDSEVYEKGQSGTLIISKWIAEERDLWSE